MTGLWKLKKNPWGGGNDLLHQLDSIVPKLLGKVPARPRSINETGKDYRFGFDPLWGILIDTRYLRSPVDALPPDPARKPGKIIRRFWVQTLTKHTTSEDDTES